MNCEICKNKKATLFYADEGGIRHALCASCGETYNKISQIDDKDAGHGRSKVIPEKTLSSFFEDTRSPSPYIRRDQGKKAVCTACGSSLERIAASGSFSCPVCYECFEGFLIQSADGEREGEKFRMPISHRSDIDRRKTLEKLKREIKSAVESENYELAATLRDKVKKLEQKIN